MIRIRRKAVWLATALLGTCSALPAVRAEPTAAPTAQQALEPFNKLIGAWRGAGQPRRGSNQGAWQQTGEFVWSFTGESPQIRYLVVDGQLERLGRFSWDGQSQRLLLELETPAGETQTYTGRWADNRLTMTTAADEGGVRRRLTITALNDKRTLVLHEQTTPGGQTFFRVAEIGYTREGARLAVPGVSGRECVVTGGAGTIAVRHQGQTYYVCCTGCQQAFEENPDAVLQEYRERLEQRRSQP